MPNIRELEKIPNPVPGSPFNKTIHREMPEQNVLHKLFTENEQEQPYQTVSLTPYAQAAMNNGRECFTKFCDYYNIDYPKDKLDNIAAAIAAYGRAEDMRDVSKIDVDGDSVLIGHYQPDLVTAEFSLQKALNTPVEESMRQVQAAENKLLQEERERQLAHEMERSRGISIS